jgi:predicted naringenin-chalcone synthase
LGGVVARFPESSTKVFLNKIATFVPPFDVHEKFTSFASQLIEDSRLRNVFLRLSRKSQIEHRWSVIEPATEVECLDRNGFYARGNFASTRQRMQIYQKEALRTVREPIQKILESESTESITHLVVTSCTGFYAPGLDLEICRHFNLKTDVERTLIGFMGCYAAFNALKMARHIVRSNPQSKVLLVNLELCTLHLKESQDLEQLMAFLQFADGCAVALVSAEPQGLSLDQFRSEVLVEGQDHIQWSVGDFGFDMILSPDVPALIGRYLPNLGPSLFDSSARRDIKLWAIHPGGRAILDSVRDALNLEESDLCHSRAILRNYGNMSSATILFVLKAIMEDPLAVGKGFACAFGPGLTVEGMLFEKSDGVQKSMENQR